MKNHSFPFFLSTLLSMQAFAETPAGIIGGSLTSGDAYSAFVSSSGGVSPISGLPASHIISAVSINSLGVALIGGYHPGTEDGYVTFVNPDGSLFGPNLSVPLTGNSVTSTAINESGQGLLGASAGVNDGYAAFIINNSPTDLASYSILSVALNDDGIGLIGGEGTLLDYASPQASYVNADGTMPVNIVLPGVPMSGDVGGTIYSVGINDSGNGILGGKYDYHDGMMRQYFCYAALVYPDRSGIEITPLAQVDDAFINSAAINNSDTGLIGGSVTGSMYAAYVSSDGTASPIFSSPPTGDIRSVSLNDAGTGLIGGQEGSNLYAAIVNPGSIQPLFSTNIPGSINSVSISESGVGLIGGQKDGTDGYAALVAPNGALTVLLLPDVSEIRSVAVLNTLADAATPEAAGPFSSVPYTQLAFSSALGSRFTEVNRVWQRMEENERLAANISLDPDSLLASTQLRAVPKTESQEKKCSGIKKNSIWVSPFGDIVHLKKRGVIPAYDNEIGGILLGYDRQETHYMIGGAIGYAFNYIHYGSSLGHGKVQEEVACLYGAYYANHFWVGATLWGGLYQFYNTRHTPVPTASPITSKGNTDGWILSPHLEMASPWALDAQSRYFVEPFFSLDWVNGWQDGYTESGSSGLNLKMKDLYSSLLQSEVGLRFYERFGYCWGDFCLEEKFSYVNQAPFNNNSVTTSFVGAASSFPIAVASSQVENLGAFELFASFEPKNRSYPYGGVDFQVTANGSYQAYFLSLTLGRDF